MTSKIQRRKYSLRATSAVLAVCRDFLSIVLQELGPGTWVATCVSKSLLLISMIATKDLAI